MQKAYTLSIFTTDGREYSSTPMTLPVASTSIDDMQAERLINNEGDEGVAIIVNSYDASGNSKFYRHDYVETYKIIAPLWSPYDAVFVIEGINEYDHMPSQAKDYIIALEAALEVPVSMISTGPERKKLIIRNK